MAHAQSLNWRAAANFMLTGYELERARAEQPGDDATIRMATIRDAVLAEIGEDTFIRAFIDADFRHGPDKDAVLDEALVTSGYAETRARLIGAGVVVERLGHAALQRLWDRIREDARAAEIDDDSSEMMTRTLIPFLADVAGEPRPEQLERDWQDLREKARILVLAHETGHGSVMPDPAQARVMLVALRNERASVSRVSGENVSNGEDWERRIRPLASDFLRRGPWALPEGDQGEMRSLIGAWLGRSYCKPYLGGDELEGARLYSFIRDEMSDVDLFMLFGSVPRNPRAREFPLPDPRALASALQEVPPGRWSKERHDWRLETRRRTLSRGLVQAESSASSKLNSPGPVLEWIEKFRREIQAEFDAGYCGDPQCPCQPPQPS